MTPENAYHHIYHGGTPTPELEDLIAKDPQFSYLYSSEVIKGPWKKGEEIISQHPWYSYLYITNITSQPLPSCHPYIFNSMWKNYYITFLKEIGYDLNEINEWLI